MISHDQKMNSIVYLNLMNTNKVRKMRITFVNQALEHLGELNIRILIMCLFTLRPAESLWPRDLSLYALHSNRTLNLPSRHWGWTTRSRFSPSGNHSSLDDFEEASQN